MIKNKSIKNKKDLNRIISKNKLMKRGTIHSKLKTEGFYKILKEAQEDPKFIKEIKEFVKATTTIHKL